MHCHLFCSCSCATSYAGTPLILVPGTVVDESYAGTPPILVPGTVVDESYAGTPRILVPGTVVLLVLYCSSSSPLL